MPTYQNPRTKTKQNNTTDFLLKTPCTLVKLILPTTGFLVRSSTSNGRTLLLRSVRRAIEVGRQRLKNSLSNEGKKVTKIHRCRDERNFEIF